ncbi:hypothetical protein [Neoroseomonas lacus]|uniref:Uncharacterized protein n=1 Tax=Neoroseomonas lacus TaxID=287609 RepID=A0A917L3P3_9PROT|nr:hypothetical protein [Neoroseomonas lacus]GGJ39129.1 hypothetical protein GCM10011320_53450 [Neoroseomonas lacus]
MAYAYAAEIEATVLALAANPAVTSWVVAWLATALGLWLRVALPLAEDDIEVAMAMAGCGM